MQELSTQLKTNLLIKEKDHKTKSEPKRSNLREDNQPQRIIPNQYIPYRPTPGSDGGINPPLPHFPQIGGSDLDPLGRGVGGGMIFDPFRPPGGRPSFNPHPGVPPGARFDPYGPPGVGPGLGRPNRPKQPPPFGAPNPDHLPPPGYDDMFM